MKKLLYLLLLTTSVSFCQTLEEYFNIGLEKAKAKDYDGAIADYTKAIELNPNNANTFINRAIGKVGLKDYDGAIADYTKAIELNPNDAIAYYSRGYIKSFWGLDSEACQDIRKAQKLGVDVKELIDVCN